MKHIWKEDELIEHFTLSSYELKHLENKTPAGRIGFSIFLKFIQYEGRFPSGPNEVPKSVIDYIAKQLDLSPDEFNRYKWQGREAKQQRSKIRNIYGFNKWSGRCSKELIEWLQTNILPEQFRHDHLKVTVLKRLQELKIEPPGKTTLKRIINSAVKNWEETFLKIYRKIYLQLSKRKWI